MKFEELTKYDYELPPHLIAQHPNIPRDKAKLIVYNRQTQAIEETDFLHLTEYLPAKSLLVFNNTRVIPARIQASRSTGGKLQLLILKQIAANQYQVLVSRKLHLKEKITLKGGLLVKVLRQRQKYYYLHIPLNFSTLIKYLEKHGNMPTPLYLKNTDPEVKLKQQYQTIFADIPGSVAAPTASLHFTKRLLKKLKADGFKVAFITLHVGLGTFAPLTKEEFTKNKLHSEYYQIPNLVWQQIKQAKNKKYPIIAVGTTAVRTLETAIRTKQLQGLTELFIQPGFSFKAVDGLITNFHLPKSSLLLLVSAFINSRTQTLNLYREAIRKKYNFYSFGDGMLTF